LSLSGVSDTAAGGELNNAVLRRPPRSNSRSKIRSSSYTSLSFKPISPHPANLATGEGNVKATQAKHLFLFFSGASALTFPSPFASGA